MSPIVKCFAMALTLLAVDGCAYRDALVLENGLFGLGQARNSRVAQKAL